MADHYYVHIEGFITTVAYTCEWGVDAEGIYYDTGFPADGSWPEDHENYTLEYTNPSTGTEFHFTGGSTPLGSVRGWAGHTRTSVGNGMYSSHTVENGVIYYFDAKISEVVISSDFTLPADVKSDYDMGTLTSSYDGGSTTSHNGSFDYISSIWIDAGPKTEQLFTENGDTRNLDTLDPAEFTFTNAGDALAGDDVIVLPKSIAKWKDWGLSVADTFFAGEGNDTITGGGLNDRINGGAGNDVIGAGDGNDNIIGGDDSDSLDGSQGDDILNGGPGNDVITGSGGTFKADNDTAVFAGKGSEYVISYKTLETWITDGIDGVDDVRLIDNFQFSNATATSEFLFKQLITSSETAAMESEAQRLLRKSTALDGAISDAEKLITNARTQVGLKDMDLAMTGLIGVVESLVSWGVKFGATGYAVYAGWHLGKVVGTEVYSYYSDQTAAEAREVYRNLMLDEFVSAATTVLNGTKMAKHFERMADAKTARDAHSFYMEYHEAVASVEDASNQLKFLQSGKVLLQQKIGDLETEIRDRDAFNAGMPRVRMEGAPTTTPSVIDDLSEVSVPTALDMQFATYNERTHTLSSYLSSTLNFGEKNLFLLGNASVNAVGNNLDNIITANGGKNSIAALEGNDKLTGGRGQDILNGGKGSDTFIFAEGDSSAKQARADLLADFSKREHDVIDLSRMDAKILTKHNDDFDLIGQHTFTKHAGELRYTQERTTTMVFGDTNGDGKSDFVIELHGKITLAEANFAL